MLVGMCFHIASGVRLGSEAVVGIVCLQRRGIVRVGLGHFKACCGMESPSGFIIVAALARVCGDYLSVSSESTQRYHVAHVIVAEASGLNSCTPLGNFATATIVLVA